MAYVSIGQNYRPRTNGSRPKCIGNNYKTATALQMFGGAFGRGVVGFWSAKCSENITKIVYTHIYIYIYIYIYI